MPLTQAEIETIHRSRTEYEQKAEKIRADRTLSDQGRQMKLAKEYQGIRAKVQGLADAARQRDESRLASLRTRLFDVGSTDPSAIISYRDALDRAEQLGPDQAGKLLTRATGAGDPLLARAVFARAWSAVGSGSDPHTPVWLRLISQYAKAYPALTEAINEAGQISNALNDQDARMKTSMLTSVGKPREIGHLPDHTIEGMAEAA